MASVEQRPADLTLNMYSLECDGKELESATNGLDPSHRLGGGGFGTACHGVQSDGADVAMEGTAVQPCGVQTAAQTHGERPKLWSLHCEIAEGIESLDAIPREHRALVHRQEAHRPLSTLLVVGRRAQGDFFRAVLADDGSREAVAREHFQIWAVPAGGSPAPGRLAAGPVPCAFFLSNLSATWTMANGTLLEAPNKCVQLHSGDRITLGRRVATPQGVCHSPLLRFRFDLTGSILSDADARGAGTAQQEPAAAAPPTPASTPALAATASARWGTPLAGDVEPRFLLEVGGEGVRERAEGARTAIAHGPPRGAASAAGDEFAPLVLGSGHAASFWQRVLTAEAFARMAPAHVAFEAVRAGKLGKGLPEVAVRSCSPTHPLLCCASVGRHSLECARTIEPCEGRQLQHGNVVVIVPAQHCSVWLRFVDLAAPRAHGAAGGA